MSVATRLLGRRSVLDALASASARSAARPSVAERTTVVLDVSIEFFGRLGGRRRRQLTTELRDRLAWELPQYMRASDVAVRQARDRVRVMLPGSSFGDAERVAERLRRSLDPGSLPSAVAIRISATTLDDEPR